MAVEYKIGEYSYGNIEPVGPDGSIVIGKFCSIGRNVQAILEGHHTDWVTVYPFQAFVRKRWPMASQLVGHPTVGHVSIGHDVWIGNNVTFIGNPIISSGSIIGANSVIAGYIAPYNIVVGNPAKKIKKRFSYYYIQKLLEIAWWDWPKSKIDENLSLLCQDDIGKFINKHRKQ